MPALEFSKDKLTPLHKISPAAKLAWGALIMLWLFLIPDPLHMFIFGLAIFTQAVIGAKIPLLRLVLTTMVIGVASIFIVVFQGILYPGETVLFAIGPLTPTLEGVKFGLTIALRVLGIVAASLTIARTTDPHDIFLWLVKLGLPYKIAYGLFIALRFIPLMEYEAQNIQAAKYVRGKSKKESKIGGKLSNLPSFLVPFIAVGMRKADQAAIAMDVRAFGLHPTRTYLRELTFNKYWGKIFVSIWVLAFLTYQFYVNTNILTAINFAPPH